MSSEDLVQQFRARLADLEARLDSGAESDEDRTTIRDEILELGRTLEGTIEELRQLKEAIRPLGERYRTLYPRRAAPRGGARIDHLGSSTYRERGWSALASGEYERAVTELRRAVELDPEEPAGLTLLAWTHLRLGESVEAGRLLAGALEKSPGNALARTVGALLDIREGRQEEAVEALTAVAGAGTDRTATLYANLYLGVAYAGRGMHREAQVAFRRALELGPNLTEGYWELGCSHHAEGRIDLALETWRAGGENRFNPWGERCREAVTRLEEERASEPS